MRGIDCLPEGCHRRRGCLHRTVWILTRRQCHSPTGGTAILSVNVNGSVNGSVSVSGSEHISRRVELMPRMADHTSRIADRHTSRSSPFLHHPTVARPCLPHTARSQGTLRATRRSRMTVRHQGMSGKAAITCQCLRTSQQLPWRLVGLSLPSPSMQQDHMDSHHQRIQAVNLAMPGMEASQITRTRGTRGIQGMLTQARPLLFLLSLLGTGSPSHLRRRQGSQFLGARHAVLS